MVKKPRKSPSKSTVAKAKATSPRITSDRLIVHDTVSHPEGAPAAGFAVTAFDQDIGCENRLGEAISDEKGAYRILHLGVTGAAMRHS